MHSSYEYSVDPLSPTLREKSYYFGSIKNYQTISFTGIYYGPARAGPLYEIRIWEVYAFLRDECIFWHSQASADSYLITYGICQGLPSDILSINIIIYFNGQYWQYWLYTWYFILYVKKFGGVFNICCVTHMSHAIYTAVSVWSINRYKVISFFDTFLNLTISFARF